MVGASKHVVGVKKHVENAPWWGLGCMVGVENGQPGFKTHDGRSRMHNEGSRMYNGGLRTHGGGSRTRVEIGQWGCNMT